MFAMARHRLWALLHQTCSGGHAHRVPWAMQASAHLSSSAGSLWHQSSLQGWSAHLDTSQDVDASQSRRLSPNLRLTQDLQAQLARISDRCHQLERMMMADSHSASESNLNSQHSSSHQEHSRNMSELQQEYGRLSDRASRWRSYCAVMQEMKDLDTLTQDPDPDLSAEARKEQALLKDKAREMEEQLLLSLLPVHVGDESRGAILEVRAGTGGAEASLFARELMDMYVSFAMSKGWQCEALELSESEAGGLRSASTAISGDGAYQQLRWESGVHRVQRVPVTETSGRVHTSTAAVVVLPEADEVEVSIRDSDLQIDTFRASGAGGQHVNTTSTAVRITHLPTGIVVSCQDERSQIRNRVKAMRVLRARVLEAERQKQDAFTEEHRKSQARSGDRNERIRTYNFSQDRLTDHRVGITHQNLSTIMTGDCLEVLDGIHSALRLQEQTEMLEDLVGS